MSSAGLAPPSDDAVAPAPKFVFARDHGERAREINEFFNWFTKRSRTMDAYRWEWQTGPAGPAVVWTITDSRDGRIVGHHGIVFTPMVCRGVACVAGRTENTIIDPAVRKKLFYPAMEKRALNEALHSVPVMYTIHSNGPGPLRIRFGYAPVGRWTVFLPKVGAGYLRSLLVRGRRVLPAALPDASLGVAARAAAAIYRVADRFAPRVAAWESVEIDDVTAVADEYQALWAEARAGYDFTIDRSLEFVRWRSTENPNLRFRTWALRSDGVLQGLVVAHRHALGNDGALYIDDLIVRSYDDPSFDRAVAALAGLDPGADTIVVMTLAIDTPLHRALRRRLPLQARLMDRFGARLFDEMLAHDAGQLAGGRPWYVTAAFTEGLDTSR